MKQSTIIYKHSSDVKNGTPKLPTKEQIDYGELAVNYAEGYETMSLRNNNDEIVTIKTDNYNEQRYLLSDNKQFTSFNTVAEYNNALKNEISAPNISTIKNTGEKFFLPINNIEIEDDSVVTENTHNELKLKYVITQEFLDALDERGNFPDKICLMQVLADECKDLLNNGQEMLTFSTTLSSFILDGVEKINDFVYAPDGYDNDMDIDVDVKVLFLNRSDVYAGQVLNAIVTLTPDVMYHQNSYDWIMASNLFWRTPLDTIETCTLLYTKYVNESASVPTGPILVPAFNIKYRGAIPNYGYVLAYGNTVYHFMLGNINYWQSGIYESYGTADDKTLTVFLPLFDSNYGNFGRTWDNKTLSAGQGNCTLWGFYNFTLRTNKGSTNIKVIGY